MTTIPIHVEITKEEVKRHLAERAAKRKAQIAQRKLAEANSSSNKSNTLLSLLLIPLRLVYNYKR